MEPPLLSTDRDDNKDDNKVLNPEVDRHPQSVLERTYVEMSERFEEFRTDPDILELIKLAAHDRGFEVPDPEADETAFRAAIQAAFDFRENTKTREELDSEGKLSEDTIKKIEALIEKFGMRRNTEPSDPQADAAIVLGGAGITPLTRTEYLLELEASEKVITSTVVMAASERPLRKYKPTAPSEYDVLIHRWRKQGGYTREKPLDETELRGVLQAWYDATDKKQPRDEHVFRRNTLKNKILGRKIQAWHEENDSEWTMSDVELDVQVQKWRYEIGDFTATEFDLMRDTAALTYGIRSADWANASGVDETIPERVDMADPKSKAFHRDWRVANAKNAAGQDILVTSAPMIDEDRFQPDGKTPRDRANTADTILFIARVMAAGRTDQDGDREVIAVTNAIFTGFQGADIKRAAAQEGILSETVGMDRAFSGLPDWQGGDPAYYLQELLSYVRQTFAAREALAQRLG